MSYFPRVSTIMALLYPNSLQFVQQEDLDRGTRLHEAMEIWVNNQANGYCGTQQYPPEVLPMMDWLREHNAEFHGAEELCSHEYGFAGHPDLLANIDARDMWIDYKFSESITEQNQMQGTVYTKLTGRPGLFLQCTKAGKVTAKRCKPNPALWSAFLSGLNVWKFREAHKPQQLTEEHEACLASQAKGAL